MDSENTKNKDLSLSTSANLLFSFLPSRIRGVYRYDQKLSEIEDDNDARAFAEIKLRFLPEEHYQGIFKNYLDIVIDEESKKGEIVDQFQRGEPYKYKKYFEQYIYFSDQLIGKENYEKADKTFLEREFVKRILSPILSAWGLLQIKPQKEICGYFADFTIIGEKKYVFEIDGFGKFKSRRDLDNFLKRQNEIINDGWTIYRFSYSDIMQNAAKTRRFLFNIFSNDPKLDRLLQEERERSTFHLFVQVKKETIPNVDPIEFVNDYYKIQDLFVDYLYQNHLMNCDHVIVKDSLDHPFPVVALSLSNLYKFLSGVEALLKVQFDLPTINVVYNKLHNGNYANYFDGKITVSHLTIEENIIFDINMDTERLSSKNHLLYQDYFDIDFREHLTIEQIKQSLSYFTGSIFRYDAGTKEFQNEVLQSIFDKKEVLGIFPTGSGKSFCFWLPALLRPGLTLVICPLRSLMRDQMMTLEHLGIASVAFINSDIKPVDQSTILNEAQLGKIKILYVAPERIRIKKFLESFSTMQDFVAVNYIVIDEAHCISEWGHDFRPSYLNIPLFYESVKVENRCVQIIALTATAGKMVRIDIMNILKLEKENVHIGKNLDRKRFSYQIVKVDGHQEKQSKFEEIVTHWIPMALTNLGVSDIYDVLKHENTRGEKAVGLIYVIYADPHGKYSINDGIAHYLYETKKLVEGISIEEEGYDPDRDYGSGRVRAFSSKVPTLCPHCGSYKYISYQNRQHQRTLFDEDIDDEESGIEDQRGIGSTEIRRGLKICLNPHCKRQFRVDDETSVGKPTRYEKLTKDNQREFKQSKFDILVATKGFGMGIDKGSVRFALHTSFASGIESWYQEAGRAGRDEERAHCVILADVPNERCYARLLEKLGAEKGIPEPECNQRKCSHGKESLCDYGKQHMFIKRSYPSVEADLVSIIKTLDKIITSFTTEPVYEDKIIFKSSSARLSKDEIALFRLMLLGIVKEFSIYYERGRPFFEVTIYTEPTKDGKITIRTNDEVIKANLVEYLNRNILYDEHPVRTLNGLIYREGQTRDVVTQFKEKYGQNIFQRLQRADLQNYSKYEGFYQRLIDYLVIILDHTYSEVLRMRYYMLWNLLEVMKSEKCRRTPILNYFHGFVEDYHCELCDNCVPDLNFERMERTPPKGTEDIEELKKELEMAIESNEFIYENLVRLKTIFKEYPESMRGMARSTLAGKPDNLVALYFLREFSPPDEKEANTLFLITKLLHFLVRV
jgi:ATP-dependent DNA helicase RecQ